MTYLLLQTVKLLAGQRLTEMIRIRMRMENNTGADGMIYCSLRVIVKDSKFPAGDHILYRAHFMITVQRKSRQSGVDFSNHLFSPMLDSLRKQPHWSIFLFSYKSKNSPHFGAYDTQTCYSSTSSPLLKKTHFHFFCLFVISETEKQICPHLFLLAFFEILKLKKYFSMQLGKHIHCENL